MDSKEYWRLREEEALKHYITEEKEYNKQLHQIYSDMLVSINEQINGFYGRYASKEGITLAEAKKRVSKLDIAAYERKAKKYVKEKNFSEQANEEMRLYNATMKINRLEMLKANIGLEMIAGHDELEKFMGDILKGRTMAELERQAGILGTTVLNSAKKAEAIVNASFKVAKVGNQSTFSDRIWQYQDIMREDLGKLLQTGLIQGKNPRAIAKDLRKYWYGNDPATGGGATYCMERLMRTELARVQTEAQKQSFERNGFEKYIFIVNKECCGHCEEASKKDIGYGKGVYLVKDMMPGENAPPLHPHDRCSTAAYEDSEEYEAWLDYLDKGGTTAEWNASGKAAWEKTKSIKNDANRQAEIKARREAYKQRKATQSTPNFDSMDKKQLEDWANKNLKTQLEDTKGVNTDLLREAIKTFNEFEKKMGGKTINGLSVKFGGLPKTLFGKYDDKTHTVLLKKQVNLDSFAKSNQEYNARSMRKLKKDYYSTNTYQGIIWHEIGHAVDIDTGQALSRSLSTKELDTKSVKISVYAGTTQNVRTTKRSEAWAENFAAYMSGENADKVPIEIVEMIEAYFKKKK